MALCLVLGWAGPAVGQQDIVGVRTADHPGFTRIVVDFAERPAWRLGRVADGYELRVDSDRLKFDLSDVYRRIADTRVTRLVNDAPGRLRVVAACDCHLETEELAGGGLVIDVRDGPSGPGNRHDAWLDEAPGPAPAPRPATRAELPIPDVGPLLLAADVLPLPGPVGGSVPVDPSVRLDAELARAAELDLVTVSILPNPESIEPIPPMPVDMVDADRAPTASNLRIRTDADTALEERRPVMAAPADPAACARAEALLDPSDWAMTGPGPGGISLDFLELVDVRGQSVPEARVKLARQYLYLTFGREARLTLEGRDVVGADDGMYLAVADIVDGMPPEERPFAGLDGCSGSTGLWAMLAGSATGHVGESPDRVATFSGWPIHLRRTLGPRLVAMHLDAGATETALGLFRATARVAQPEDPAFLMVSARLADILPAISPDAAIRTVANGQSPESAEALIAVVDARIAEGVPVGTDLSTQAGARAFEMVGQPEAERLRAAEIRSLIHDGLWRAALDRLSAPEAIDGRAGLWTSLVAGAAARAGDAEVLWLAGQVEKNTEVSVDARLALADRVLDLGLPDMARRALDLGVAIPTEPQRRMLARIALAEGRLDVAEAYLSGLADSEAKAMLAEIGSRRARQATSAAMTAAAALDSGGETAARSIPPAALAEPGGEGAPAGRLEASRALLAASEKLRADLRGLVPPRLKQ